MANDTPKPGPAPKQPRKKRPYTRSSAASQLPVEREERSGTDGESSRRNQTFQNWYDRRRRGERVAYDEPDPVAKFENLRSVADFLDCNFYVFQSYPETNYGIPPLRFRAFRSWGDILNHIRPHRTAGPSTWTWRLSGGPNHGTVAQADFQLSGDPAAGDQPAVEEVDDVAKQPQPPAPVWDGYRWVTPQPPPPAGYAPPTPYQPPPGYQLVPIGAAPQPQYAPPAQPPPMPPQPQPGDTAETLALRYEKALAEHENKELRRRLEQLERLAMNPQPQPQVDPQTMAMRDPNYLRWYYTQGPGREQLGTPLPAAAPPAMPEVKKSPIEQIEEGTKYLESALEMGKAISKKFAPPEAKPPPAPAPAILQDDDHPVKVRMIGDIAIPAIGDQIPATLFAAGNVGLIENKLGKAVDKIVDVIDRGKKAKVEAAEAEKSAVREAEEAAERQRKANAEAADAERKKNEDHMREMSRIKAEEELAAARRIIEEARQARDAKPPEPERVNLGTLGRKAPPDNGVVEPVPVIVAESKLEEPEETTPN